jgi:hypothetical protein
MATRLIAVLHALWPDRICRHLTRGLSAEEFRAQGHFAGSAFYRWRRRLKLMSLAERCAAPPAPSAFVPASVRLAENDFHDIAPNEADGVKR